MNSVFDFFGLSCKKVAARKPQTYLSSLPEKFFSRKRKKYVYLRDAKVIKKLNGKYYDSEFLDLKDDIGTSIWILYKAKKYYLVMKNIAHSGLQMQYIGNEVYIRECDTKDEAQFYAEEQMRFWK